MTEADIAALYAQLADDFEFWASQCCRIRTKLGEIIPFTFNRVQKRFVRSLMRMVKTTGRVRVVVLKARQQGLSTLIMAFQYWWLSNRAAQKGLVMAHEADSTISLFDMYRRCHDNVPELVRPHTKYSSRTELVFDKLDSALRVATAGGRGVARGETLNTMHLSEVAFWPVAFAKANFSGLIRCVPNADGTAVFLESTAQGMTGPFRDMWLGAVEGSNGYEPFFSAWFESDEYRLPVPADFKRSPEEQRLCVDWNEYMADLYGPGHDIDDAQLQWRRVEINRDGIEQFHQECPTTPDEAFISTGAPVFNPAQVSRILKNVPEPVGRYLVTDGLVEENPAGELTIFHDYPERNRFGSLTGNRINVSPKESYVIGADVGMGIRGKDYSVAQVLDGHMRQVAVWRGYVHPDRFAIILRTLGLYYNDALVAPERNNHGLLTCTRLRDLHYPNIYTEAREGELDEEDTLKIGFLTTEKSKPLIIDKLRAAMRKQKLRVNDPTTLREMLSFIVTPGGRMEGDAGSHDDTVMALAIATHIHEGIIDVPAVSDDFYVEAI